MVGTEKTSAKVVSKTAYKLSEVELTVDFFQSKLLSLSLKTEDHDPGEKIEPSVATN